MKKLKVLHINNYDKKGGAETVFNYTRKNLEGVENYSGFIKLDNKGDDSNISFNNCKSNNKIINSLNYIYSFENKRKLLSFLKSHQIDIIHLHAFIYPLTPSILQAITRIKKKNKIKVIETLHGFHLVCPNLSLFNYKKNELCNKCVGKHYKFFIFTDNCDGRNYFYSLLKGIKYFISDSLIKHKEIVDHFIAPSEFLRNKMLEDKIPNEKISIVRNPIIINEQKLFSKKENIICFFGRFTREKNIKFLINAFNYWKEKNKNDFKLLLIGEGEKESKLKELAKNSEFYKYIIFKKFIPREKLFDEIKRAKYFSMASIWYENAPMTIWESISLNIIPVVPNLGGMKESIDITGGIGKTYITNNIQSWCNALDVLESNYLNEYDNLIKLKKEILTKYSLENYLLKIKEVYENQLINI